jgi:hypothetical protein
MKEKLAGLDDTGLGLHANTVRIAVGGFVKLLGVFTADTIQRTHETDWLGHVNGLSPSGPISLFWNWFEHAGYSTSST